MIGRLDNVVGVERDEGIFEVELEEEVFEVALEEGMIRGLSDGLECSKDMVGVLSEIRGFFDSEGFGRREKKGF